jgi:CxxC-x17-CxxC domain-containing protein
MELQDKNLTCRDCNSVFVFTAGEQGFYIEKGLMNEPQRCPDCRANRRRERSSSTTREGATITCASCGQEAQVPFVPRLDRPVYCNDCFSASKDRQPVAAS